LARDVLQLAFALGHNTVAGVVGHDFGSPVAAWRALVRPDVFRRVVLMSAPFTGPPKLPFGVSADADLVQATEDIYGSLAHLDPPRKHYQWYFSTREANIDMHLPTRALHDFLRAYYHYKSGDWPGNRPFSLTAWSAAELAKLPAYYVMDLRRTMPETVASEMPSAAQVAACSWLPDHELAVYTREYVRTGFQGGLNWYRCRTSGRHEAELGLFAGRTIDVPAMFIAGARDWGTHQVPGAFECMQGVCTHMAGCHLIEQAGHWVQQERPDDVVALISRLLNES
jgi:non-specific protein-tyrosine kinase